MITDSEQLKRNEDIIQNYKKGKVTTVNCFQALSKKIKRKGNNYKQP
jgi:hypothetical protein